MNDMGVLVIGTIVWLALSVAILTGGTGSVSSRGRHRAGVPWWVLVELPAVAALVDSLQESIEERRRAEIYRTYTTRRASEAPLFARLAAEMGLSLALGVAA